jgi:endonuclease/exonuclease/phosphatase family metal-dependent hydrolase
MRQWRRRLSRVRWVARLLPITLPEGETDAPGLIMIQIDGLSRPQLEAALKRRWLPFIRRLAKSEHVRLHSFYAGIPSSTPAVQAELFYGVKSAVPAFAYLHRQSGELFSMNIPQAAQTVAAELAPQSETLLLQGGNAYADIYAGGAAEARFCAETMDLGSLLKQMHPLKWVLLPIFYGFKIVRVLTLALLETVLVLFDFVRGVFDRKDIWQEFKFIASCVGVGIVLREIVRFMVRLDIERGIPVVHANFLGYDEQSHRRGPNAYFARWSLRGIDAAVRDIVRSAQRSDYRDYEVIIYSDHGQQSARPYATIHGESIRQAVRRVLEALWNGEISVPDASENNDDSQRDPFGRGLLLAKRHAPPIRPPDLAQRVTVTAKGPLGHIYLPLALDDNGKQVAAQALVNEASVPLVLYVAADGQVEAFNAQGRFRLPRDAEAVLGREHPFLRSAAEDLAATCRHPDAGELVISGWQPQSQPLTFSAEHGAHGGPGDIETHGFVLLPDALSLPAGAGRHSGGCEPFLRALDLRRIALEYLKPAQRPPAIAPAAAHTNRTAPLPNHDRRLTVMTYNAHSCIGTDGKVRPRRIARLIASFQPDIVAMQELDVRRRRTGRIDQAALIAGELNMEHVFLPLIQIDEGAFGIAFFSRWPFTVVKARSFADTPTPAREPRGALWIRVNLNGATIHVVNTHLGLSRRERLAQAQTLLGPQWLGSVNNGTPVILSGDLNSRPRSAVYDLMQKNSLGDVQIRCADHRPQATFASYRPFTRIDHIFVSSVFTVESVCVPTGGSALKASDHLPLQARLTLPGPEPDPAGPTSRVHE